MVDLARLAVSMEGLGFSANYDEPSKRIYMDFQGYSGWNGLSEYPPLAFAFLDAIECAGYRPGIYLMADTEKEPGSEPKEPVYCCGTSKVLTYGSNRTQAIARQLIALHEAGVLEKKSPYAADLKAVREETEQSKLRQ